LISRNFSSSIRLSEKDLFGTSKRNDYSQNLDRSRIATVSGYDSPAHSEVIDQIDSGTPNENEEDIEQAT
jgi:hypothetical protein